MNDDPDYRDTVFLPSTGFPMRGDLPKKEPGLLARWQGDAPAGESAVLWQKLREMSAGRPMFILHEVRPMRTGICISGTR